MIEIKKVTNCKLWPDITRGVYRSSPCLSRFCTVGHSAPARFIFNATVLPAFAVLSYVHTERDAVFLKGSMIRAHSLTLVYYCAGSFCHSGVNRNSDLQRKIYAEVHNAPACVRLLNATGTVGCAADPVAAPLLPLGNAATDSVPGKIYVALRKQI